jgi:putative ABC transport system substrate-binding protein
LSAMRQKLANLGWVESRNIHIEYRWAGGDSDKARAYARELVGMTPSVIVTSTNQVTEIARRETLTIPIVFASLGDPVGSGLVASLSRPGGNVTGFPAYVESMAGKWLELLKEASPTLKQIGFIYHPDAAPHRGLLSAAQSTAPSLNLKLVPLPVRDANDISASIAAIGSEADAALAVASHAVTFSNRDLLIRLATGKRLPTVFGDPVFGESGGLLSYGSDPTEAFLGAASYVDLILKGARPAEMPVQLPTKFNLVINLKTAKAIGIAVPEILLVRADKVIE